MNRRTFLRVLGSAAVAVAVAPVESLLQTVDVSRFLLPGRFAGMKTVVGETHDWGRPLTYEMLESAYKSCIVGQFEPQLVIADGVTIRRLKKTFRELGLVYDAEVA